jgi:hypothetical protein
MPEILCCTLLVLYAGQPTVEELLNRTGGVVYCRMSNQLAYSMLAGFNSVASPTVAN